jgi:hypothetical protein
MTRTPHACYIIMGVGIGSTDRRRPIIASDGQKLHYNNKLKIESAKHCYSAK